VRTLIALLGAVLIAVRRHHGTGTRCPAWPQPRLAVAPLILASRKGHFQKAVSRWSREVSTIPRISSLQLRRDLDAALALRERFSGTVARVNVKGVAGVQRTKAAR